VSEVYFPTIIPFYQKYPLEGLPMSQSLIPVVTDDLDEIQMLKEFNVVASLKLLNSERIMARQRTLKPLIEELINLIDRSIEE